MMASTAQQPGHRCDAVPGLSKAELRSLKPMAAVPCKARVSASAQGYYSATTAAVCFMLDNQQLHIMTKAARRRPWGDPGRGDSKT